MNPLFIMGGLILLYMLLNNNSTATAEPMYKYAEGFKTVNDFSASISEYSASYSIPFSRIAAIIACESSGNPSPQPDPGAAGEVGLMQMTPGALKTVNSTLGFNWQMNDLHDPDIAIHAGTAYLAILYGHTRNLDNATRAYNAGLGHVAADPQAGGAYLNRVKMAELTIQNILNP
jgi:soluble lytic murein transglycosylase-like protein